MFVVTVIMCLLCLVSVAIAIASGNIATSLFFLVLVIYSMVMLGKEILKK